MKLQWSSQFAKDYHKLPQQLQKQTDKALGLLLQDWRHPSLQAKKMKGERQGEFEARITKNYRFTYQVRGNVFLLLRVGTHKEITGR
jgi:addiction module RelE/StbE family toxin